MSSFDFSTLTAPGETTCQLPCELESVHVAPVVGGVAMPIV
ncbi:MAG TPA: hypothetical protein VGL35_01535 [Rhizomicrobium sp.]|jgi:hypothetical protein